ncbi:MAG: hypothetical protein WCA59_12905, partial [Candidatus Binataceae bacterium]
SRNGRLRFEQPGPAVRIHLAPASSLVRAAFSGGMHQMRPICGPFKSVKRTGESRIAVIRLLVLEFLSPCE